MNKGKIGNITLSVIFPFPEMSSNRSAQIFSHVGIPVLKGIQNGNFHDGFVPLEEVRKGSWRIKNLQFIESDWVLFLEEGEFLDEKSIHLLLRALPDLKSCGHFMTIARHLPQENIRAFDWVTTTRILSSPTINMITYHSIEVRLVPKPLIEGLIIERSDDPIYGKFQLRFPHMESEANERELVPISISRFEPDLTGIEMEDPEDYEIFLKGHRRFFNDRDFVEEFDWPRTIYVLIRKDHVPIILKGLKEGATSRSIVIHTLNYLLRMGDFQMAGQFLPFIPEHWEIYEPVIGQMKALILLFTGMPNEAREIAQKVSTYAPEIPAFMENMGKIFLLLGERERASECFKQALDGIDENDGGSHLRTFLSTLGENCRKRPTLTCCILCRDEEKLISRALKSVYGIADEILVVDTGSKDKSRDIAREFGAKVIEFPWDDDFSSARNFAIKHVNSDYILMLDADEYLFPVHLVDFHVMKQLLPLEAPRAFSLPIGHLKIETDWMNVLVCNGNFVTETHSVRIFPAINGICYRGRIKEDIVDSLSKMGIPITTLPENQMRIHHEVNDREWRILRKVSAYEKEEDPNLSQIASAVKEFSFLNDIKNTIKWLKMLVERGMEKRLPSIARIGIGLAGLLEEISTDEAKAILIRLNTLFPEDRELLKSISSHFIKKGSFSEVTSLKIPLTERANEMEDPDFLVHKAIFHIEMGEISSAVKILDKVLLQNSIHLLGQVARFYLFCKLRDFELAINALEEIVEITNGGKVQRISSRMEFLRTVERLSESLGKWGHGVERSLLLHGTLFLEGVEETSK
jgi:glycosyltransferase involved in cell wall biosynthesis